MRLIKEPLNVDFYFEGKQMTDDDQRRVSEFIALKKIQKRRKSGTLSQSKKKDLKSA